MSKYIAIVVTFCILFTGCANGNSTTTNDKELKKFMEEREITLTSKEVQYDKEQNKTTPFAIKGEATLSDFYAYGLGNTEAIEKDFYCIRVDQETYSEGWYIYLERESFSDLYDELLLRPVEVIVECVIPVEAYDIDMTNLAMGLSIKW